MIIGEETLDNYFLTVLHIFTAAVVGLIVISTFLLLFRWLWPERARRLGTAHDMFLKGTTAVILVLFINMSLVSVLRLRALNAIPPEWHLVKQASILLSAGRYDEVIRTLEPWSLGGRKGETFTPPRRWLLAPQLNLLLAEAYQSRGQRSDTLLAVANCKRAVSFYNNAHVADPQFAFRAGMLFLKLGLAEDSIGLLQEAAVLSPSNAEVWFTLGDAYYQDGRIHAAREAFRKAVLIGADPWATRAKKRLHELPLR